MNIYGNKKGWAQASLGFAAILLIVSQTSTYGGALYQFIVSFAAPFVFFLSGYRLKRTNHWKDLALRTAADAWTMILPSIAAVFIRGIVSYNLDNTIRHTAYYLQMAMRGIWISLLYAAPEQVGDAATIDLLWILFALFFLRFIANLVHVIFSIFRRGDEIANGSIVSRVLEYAVLVVLAVIGNSMPRHGILLPFNLNNVLNCVLFMTAGLLYRELQNVLDKPAVTLPMSIGSLVVWIYSFADGTYLNSNAAVAVWRVGTLFTALCACIGTASICRQIFRLNLLRGFFRIYGRHFSVLLVVYYLDFLTSFIWKTPYTELNCLTRVLWLLAVTTAICAIGDRLELLPDPGIFQFTRKYWRGISFFFYIILLIGLGSGASWSGLINRSMDQDIFRALAILVLTGSLLIWAFSITKEYARWIPVIQASFLIVTIVYCSRGGEEALLYTVAMMLAASEKPFRKIMAVALSVIIVIAAVTYRMSMTGLLEYKIKVMGDNSAHTFGFMYANHVGMILMMICMMYLSVRNIHRGWTVLTDILIMGAALYFNYRYLNSATSLVSSAFLLVLDLFYRVCLMIRERGGRAVRKSTLFTTVLGITIYPVMMVLSIILPISLYRNGGTFLGEELLSRVMDVTTLNARMKISFNTLANIPAKLFGNYFAESTAIGSYFVIDSFYIRLLIRYGILISILFFVIILHLQFHSARVGKGELVLIMGILAVYGFSETVLLSYTYCPLILMAFADVTDLVKRKRGRAPVIRRDSVGSWEDAYNSDSELKIEYL